MSKAGVGLGRVRLSITAATTEVWLASTLLSTLCLQRLPLPGYQNVTLKRQLKQSGS